MSGRASGALGVVLAGGSGTRLGGPKAALELAGRPLIDYLLAAFRQAGVEAVVVAKRTTSLPELGVPIWREPERPSHPLCGIVAALRRSKRKAIVVVGCDMPFVSATLLAALAAQDAALVVPRQGGRLQPLTARYDRVHLDALEAALAQERPLHSVVAALEPVVLDEEALRRFGDPAVLFLNVNTPSDLAEAERHVARVRGASRRSAGAGPGASGTPGPIVET